MKKMCASVSRLALRMGIRPVVAVMLREVHPVVTVAVLTSTDSRTAVLKPVLDTVTR